jgi:hypothetical protein
MKERYKKFFKEERYSDDEYESLFKAQSQGGKVWIKVFQSDVDKKYNSFTIHGSNSGSGVDDSNLLKQTIFSELIGSLLNDYGTIKKIDIDKIGIAKDWQYFLSKIKNYDYLEKSLKGSEQRRFYFSMMNQLSSNLRRSQKINNISLFIDQFLQNIDKIIEKQNW